MQQDGNACCVPQVPQRTANFTREQYFLEVYQIKVWLPQFLHPTDQKKIPHNLFWGCELSYWGRAPAQFRRVGLADTNSGRGVSESAAVAAGSDPRLAIGKSATTLAIDLVRGLMLCQIWHVTTELFSLGNESLMDFARTCFNRSNFIKAMLIILLDLSINS